MNIKELLERIEKLQRRWTYHAVEHRGKRDNNDPNYNAYDHGVATGYLKALNTFKDWARRLDTIPEQPVEGLEEAAEEHTFFAANQPGQDWETHDVTNAFKAGAEWMKAKMLEEAVEGIAHPDDCEIWVNLVGYGYKFKDGDKVRVIVIKEYEK